MGHQVNFWAAPADIAKIQQSLREIEPMLILHARSPSEEPRNLSTLTHTESLAPWLFFNLVRASDLESVTTKHVPAQGYWTVDIHSSPVVEFTSCFFDGRVLGRGRVYFVDGFYDEHGAWVVKPEGFRAWAKSSSKVTRRCLARHETDYIGSAASQWLAQGEGTLRAW